MSNIEINYNGQSFFLDIAEGKMVSLHDIYKMAGSPKNQEPKEWVKLTSTKNLIESINGGKSPILKTKRGINGGTWGHWQVALAYAQYLSPELHIAVNQVFKERLEEILNPELGIQRSRDRARRSWKAQGRSDEWIASREKGIESRHGYVDTLLNHDVKPGAELGRCTNNIYKGIFNKDKSGIEQAMREKNPDLPKRLNIRDNMKRSSLAAIGLAEALASEEIEDFDIRGVDPCAKVSFDKGMSVRKALEDSRAKAPRIPPAPARLSEKGRQELAAIKGALS